MTEPNTAASAAAKTDPKSKERSPNYPSMTLTDAIGIVGRLYEKEKRTVLSPEDAAKALGYGALSGAARTTIAALRQYGLLENSGHGVRISDLAMDIVHQPAESAERRFAVASAAKKPALIAELIPTHADASDETIRAYLITKKKFSPEGAGRFVSAFRDALKLAGMDSSGEPSEQPGAGAAGEGRVNTPPGKTPKPPAQNPGVQMQFTWPLSGDVVATLTVSRQIETDDVDTLSDYFEIAKKALLKAARKAPAKEAFENGDEAQA
jgi:hypothetical protein